MKNACVVLAAGLGKRMNSSIPKVLHLVCGKPMLQHVINAAEELKPEEIIVVAGRHVDSIKKALFQGNISFAIQKEARGTGHALQSARSLLGDFQGIVIVLNGDTPLISSRTIRKFLSLHRKDGNAVSVLSFIAANPDDYGRIARDSSGRIKSIIEHKDADAEQKKISEVNSGVYAINSHVLYLLDEIRINRAKGEYYLTDIIEVALRKGLKTSAYCIAAEQEFLGVNTKEELYRASLIMRKGIVRKWIEKGVIFLDADSAFIHPDAYIGTGTVIYPNVFLEGKTRIGRDSTIYPNVRIVNSSIGNNVIIMDATVIEGSQIKDRASVGPFAHLRPGNVIGSDAKIGNFVELKKAVIGRGTKASHLSYLGDAKIGNKVNIGAGTITCNYDGREKHLTTICDGVFIGSDTQLVAPVTVGKGAYVGAGSTITHDVPAEALAISRVQQKNIRGWVKKRQAKAKRQKTNVKHEKDK